MAKKWGEAGNTFSSIAQHHVKVVVADCGLLPVTILIIRARVYNGRTKFDNVVISINWCTGCYPDKIPIYRYSEHLKKKRNTSKSEFFH